MQQVCTAFRVLGKCSPDVVSHRLPGPPGYRFAGPPCLTLPGLLHSVPSGLLRAPSDASSTDSWVPVEPPTAQPSYVQEPPLCAEGSQAVSAAEPAGTLQTLDPQALQLSEAQQPRAAKGVGFASEPTYSEGSPPRTGRSRSESPSTLARDVTIASNSHSMRTTPRESGMPPWAGSDSASDAATLTKRKSQALYLAALMQVRRPMPQKATMLDLISAGHGLS